MARTDWNALEQSAVQKLQQGEKYTVAQMDAVLTAEERSAVIRDAIGARKHFQITVKVTKGEGKDLAVDGLYSLKGGA